MPVDFKKKHAFSPVVVDEKEFITVVNSAKILGITLCNDLKWNVRVNETIKKANNVSIFWFC